MSITNFPNGIGSFGVPVMPGSGGPIFTGNAFFVSATGADGNDGASPSSPMATLYGALSRCVSGNNDVIYLIGNGAASGSARVSLAGAQAINSAATGGALLWNKNATHLVGIASGSNNSRARIAPPTGVYTAATFVDTTMVNVTGTGCTFMNISAFAGFSTGVAAFIAWTENGGRNAYINCQFQGMNDAVSAGDAGSRSLKVMGTVGENTFTNCIIGDDTTARGAANASLEFAGGTPRNTFTRCVFPLDDAATAGILGILGTGNACMDRWQIFDSCLFLNDTKSGSTAMTVLASLTTASPGGYMVFKNCDTVGITKFGDTNALANSYVSNVGGAATGGLNVNPS